MLPTPPRRSLSQTTSVSLPSHRSLLESSSSFPTTQVLFELRVQQTSPLWQRMEIWQLPSSFSPNLAEPCRIAFLSGQALRTFSPQLCSFWHPEIFDLPSLAPKECISFALSEDVALLLGLAFRLLAPMRNRSLMRQCLSGLQSMSPQEAAYWLGMAMHRPQPLRVLQALRTLLQS